MGSQDKSSQAVGSKALTRPGEKNKEQLGRRKHMGEGELTKQEKSTEREIWANQRRENQAEGMVCVVWSM